MSTKLAIEILDQYWGFNAFRSKQEEVITNVLEGNDTLALLPTGGGKSLCYQVPAMVNEGICIVVSPLVALIKDQVSALREKGIRATEITGGISFDELSTILDNCTFGNYKFLYLSPERLQQKIVRERISQMNVNLIAIDEAHCISQWGHDFRPAYLSIKEITLLCPGIPVLALTATATERVVKDILVQLDMEEATVVQDSFARKNLALHVYETENKQNLLIQSLNKTQSPSIVYVRNRRKTIELSRILNANGLSSTYYHGGLTSDEKDRHLKLWLNDRVHVMVATNAFGMGIDKPDVRKVVHLQLPESLESYFQEIGRAGRDGEYAEATLFVNPLDFDQLQQQFSNTVPTTDMLKKVYRKLNSYLQIGYGEGSAQTFQLDFRDFCDTYKLPASLTFNALKALDRYSIINMSQYSKERTHVKCVVDNFGLHHYLDTHKRVRHVAKAILRTYGGIFDTPTPINVKKVALKCQTTAQDVTLALQQLDKDGIFEVAFMKSDTEISFLVPREDDKTINRISKYVEALEKVKRAQMQAMVDFVKNDDYCKKRQLLHYFDEESHADCGICSVCRTKNSTMNTDHIANEIVNLVKAKPATSNAILEQVKGDKVSVLNCLRMLLEEQKLKINNHNQYELA